MPRERIIVTRVWRSEWHLLLLTLACAALAFAVTRTEFSEIFIDFCQSIGLESLANQLSRVWLLPAGVLLWVAYRIYNIRYSVDPIALEMRSGRLSWKQVITRLRLEDIRSIETRQSVIDQMLGIGSIEIGTAASAGAEMVLSGIANPRKIQQVILEERDTREKR